MSYLDEMNDEDDDLAARPAPPPKSLVDQIVDELNSGFKHGGGPCKEINGVEVGEPRFDSEHGKVMATVTVLAYQESPWGDSANTKRQFDVPIRDMRLLAEKSTDYRAQFARASASVEAQVAAFEKDFEKNRAEGMPTGQPTTIMKPLRWKNRWFSLS